MRSRICCVLLAAAAIPQFAHAQSETASSAFQRDRNVSVRERPRPDFDALGLRASTFLVYPKVEVTVAQEDNVFATETNTAEDTVATISPSISAISQWSRHELQGYARANAYRYNQYDLQNSTTYAVGGTGRLDVVRGTALTGGVSYNKLVEPRTSASSPDNAAKPVKYDQFALDLGASREVNRFRYAAKLRYRDYAFDDSVSGAGVPLDLSYRDNTSVEGELRADYAISPAVAVYVTALANNWDFGAPRLGDVARDANGYQASVGADFEITRLVRGQVQVGHLDQNFKDPKVKDANGLALLGRLEYFPTQLLTFTTEAERSVQATGVALSPGVLHSELSFRADYELLRNLILSGSVRRFSDDYQGIDRTDDFWGAMVGAYYLVNRRVGVNLIYNHFDQDSSGTQRGRTFEANRLQAGLVLQY